MLYTAVVFRTMPLCRLNRIRYHILFLLCMTAIIQRFLTVHNGKCSVVVGIHYPMGQVFCLNMFSKILMPFLFFWVSYAHYRLRQGNKYCLNMCRSQTIIWRTVCSIFRFLFACFNGNGWTIGVQMCAGLRVLYFVVLTINSTRWSNWFVHTFAS